MIHWPDARGSRGTRGALRAALLLCAACGWLTACGKPDEARSATRGGEDGAARDSVPTRLPPAYSIDPALREMHPELCRFLDHFMAVCGAGDYARYRQLVGRSFEPESRERFEKIHLLLQRIHVEAVEPVSIPSLPAQTYRVVSTIELQSGERPRQRGGRRKLAILVFTEQGEFRMAPAPASMQPRDEAGASQPAQSEPAPEAGLFFPWDLEDPAP